MMAGQVWVCPKCGADYDSPLKIKARSCSGGKTKHPTAEMKLAEESKRA